MDPNMLPAQSYEEAIPFLRRPYTPNLVRGLVSTPRTARRPHARSACTRSASR